MTTAGELLYSDLLNWQRDFSLTQQRFADIQGLKRGKVAIGLVQALTEGPLCGEIGSIAHGQQWLDIELAVESSQVVSRMVRDAVVDFGLILDPGTVSGIEVIAFAELAMGIVVPPRHRLSDLPSVSLSELHDQRHIIPGKGLVVHDRVQSLYQRAGQPPASVISCNDIRLIRSLVANGTGISVLSRLDVMEDLRLNRLCFIPIKHNPLRPVTLGLCTAPSRQLSRAAQYMIQRLSGIIEEMNSTAAPDGLQHRW